MTVASTATPITTVISAGSTAATQIAAAQIDAAQIGATADQRYYEEIPTW